jgi:hypothetical protein
LDQEEQSKDHLGKTVVDGAPQMGFADAPRNSAPFAPRPLLHNPPRDVGAAYNRYDSSASTKRVSS